MSETQRPGSWRVQETNATTTNGDKWWLWQCRFDDAEELLYVGWYREIGRDYQYYDYQIKKQEVV